MQIQAFATTSDVVHANAFSLATTATVFMFDELHVASLYTYSPIAKKSTSTWVVSKNAAALFCCEAPEMFRKKKEKKIFG